MWTECNAVGNLHRVITGRGSALISAFVLGFGVLLIVGLGQATRAPAATDQLPQGYDSTRVAQLQERLPAKDSSTAVVLFTGDVDQGRMGELSEVVADLGVDRVSAPRSGPVVIPSEDGRAAISVLAVEATGATDIAEGVTSLRDRLEETTPDGVEAAVTGPAAVQADLAAVFDGADFRLLAATVSIVALLLVITYRSPILWVVPLLVVGIADQAATVLATHTLATLSVPWDESTTGILSVLVFGAGTDYALLLISRYRDELRSHEDRREAMAIALRRTSHAVLASSTTVVLGVLSLALSAFPTTRGLGIACAVGIVVAALFALVALPATLLLFGRWVFWPKVPRVGTESLAESRSVWRRVGDAVNRRTTSFVVGTLLLLGVLGSGLASVSLGLPTADQFLQKPEAISAGERLAEYFPAGSSDPATVMTRTPEAATTALEGLEGVDSVRTGDTAAPWTELSVVLEDPADSDGAGRTVERMRASLDDLDAASYVGGTAAGALDAGEAASRDRWVIFPVILVLVLGRAGAPAALGGGAGAVGAHRAGHLRRGAGCGLVAVHRGLRLQRAGRRDAAPGLLVPGRAGCGLQHLPGHPGVGGGARARFPRRDAASAGGDRRRDHQRRHPAGRGVRRARGAAARRPRPARRGDLPRRAPRHARGAHRAGAGSGAAAGRPVLVAACGAAAEHGRAPAHPGPRGRQR